VNDLDLVRAFAADTAWPAPDRLRCARERLLTAIAAEAAPSRSRPGVRRGPRPAWRTRPGALAAATAIALAAAVAVVVISDGSRTAASHSGRGPAHYVLAAEILRAAAHAQSAQPGGRPAPAQWLYGEAVEDEIGQPAQENDSWLQFDGRQSAYFQGGRLIVHTSPVQVPIGGGDPMSAYLNGATPMSAYDALAALPSGAGPLLAAVDRAIVASHWEPDGLPSLAAVPESTPRQLEFEFLGQLLWNASQAAPAAAEASVYRAMITIPGVTAQTGVTDAAGRPAIALSNDGGVFQLLLDPTSYAVLGLRSVSNGSAPVAPAGGATSGGAPRPWPAGTVVESIAWADAHQVAGPGQR